MYVYVGTCFKLIHRLVVLRTIYLKSTNFFATIKIFYLDNLVTILFIIQNSCIELNIKIILLNIILISW